MPVLCREGDTQPFEMQKLDFVTLLQLNLSSGPYRVGTFDTMPVGT
jgi:hypothetical protein